MKKLHINTSPFVIERCSSKKIFKFLARSMCISNPWLTLGYTYNECYQSFLGKNKEIYIIKSDILLGAAILQIGGTFNGYLQTLFILPNARNMGAGEKLLHYCEKRILTESPNIFLCVSSFNKKAIKFYARNGYEKIGVLKNFLVNGFDEILMRKTVGEKKGYDGVRV